MKTENIRVCPERYDLVPGRSDDIETSLHIPDLLSSQSRSSTPQVGDEAKTDGEMRHVIHIETPLSTENGKPPSSLAIMGISLGWLEMGWI